MTDLFDDQLLDEFARTFYGYGNFGARVWFVGMEEGGGNSFGEVARRLQAWAERGKQELEDVAEYHAALGITALFDPQPKLQRTWGKLIRILLASRHSTPTIEQVRQYQGQLLGRRTGETCLLELLPLPSPSTANWLYGQHSRLPYLVDRAAYRRVCLPPRIAHLKRRLQEHRPPVVIFYSRSYQEHWEAIAEVNLTAQSDELFVGRSATSLFLVTKHPATKGVSNEYFHHIGRRIATELAMPSQR